MDLQVPIYPNLDDAIAKVVLFQSVHHVNDPLKVTTETYTHSDQIDVVLQSWPIGSHFSNRQTDPEIQVDIERQCDDYDSKEHIVSTSHPFSNFERSDRTP